MPDRQTATHDAEQGDDAPDRIERAEMPCRLEYLTPNRPGRRVWEVRGPALSLASLDWRTDPPDQLPESKERRPQACVHGTAYPWRESMTGGPVELTIVQALSTALFVCTWHFVSLLFG